MFLTFILNKRRLVKLGVIDQFIMAYGGLRGGIAFCLALSLDEKLVPEKRLFVTATIIIVFFTVFIQVCQTTSYLELQVIISYPILAQASYIKPKHQRSARVM